jgi:hypothetical protein
MEEDGGVSLAYLKFLVYALFLVMKFRVHVSATAGETFAPRFIVAERFPSGS